MHTAWSWTSNDAILHTLPLNHVHGIVNVLLTSLYSGATCEFVNFEAGSVWERIRDREKKLTLFMAVPTIYSKLAGAWNKMPVELQTASTEACGRFRVMISGSAPLPTTMFDEWERISGHRLLERYGMSEIGMALGNPLDGERVPGTVGMPFPGVDVKLISTETGEEVTDKIGEDVSGEILVKGPQVFLEYWKRPEATTEVFTEDHWFKTGDIAVREPNGYFRILGRASMDIIKVRRKRMG